MEFFLRYFKYHICMILKKAWVGILLMSGLVAYIAYTELLGGLGYTALSLALLVGVASVLLVVILIILFEVLAQYSTFKVFNTEGFSDKFLRLYEQKHIVGRPYNENNTIVFTEIMVCSGHLNEAMQYFNMIHISESNVFAYTSLIYLKMLAGVKAGDPAYSDRVWQENQHFIGSFTSKRDHEMHSGFLYLGLVYTDCANGRYERALQQTVTYMNSKEFRRYRTAEFNFRIIQLFILKVLGREEFSTLAPQLKADIEAHEYLYDWEKPQYLSEYSRALNGEYPW